MPYAVVAKTQKNVFNQVGILLHFSLINAQKVSTAKINCLDVGHAQFNVILALDYKSTIKRRNNACKRSFYLMIAKIFAQVSANLEKLRPKYSALAGFQILLSFKWQKIYQLK